MVEKLIPNPFLKRQIEHISRSIVKSFIQFVYTACQVERYQNILQDITSTYKAFLKKEV